MKIKAGDKVTGKYFTGEIIKNKKVYATIDNLILLVNNKYGWKSDSDYEKGTGIVKLNRKYRYYWYTISFIENLKIKRN